VHKHRQLADRGAAEFSEHVLPGKIVVVKGIDDHTVEVE
jgi:hypothetical protein